MSISNKTEASQSALGGRRLKIAHLGKFYWKFGNASAVLPTDSTKRPYPGVRWRRADYPAPDYTKEEISKDSFLRRSVQYGPSPSCSNPLIALAIQL